MATTNSPIVPTLQSNVPRPQGIAALRGRIGQRFDRRLQIGVLLLISFIMLAPFVWVLATSLRTPAQSFSLPPQWIPVNPDFSNYQQVFVKIPFWNQFLNSAIITLSIVLGQLFTAALAGYAFAHLKFPGKNLLFYLVLATLMIPLQATIIPVFMLISQFKLNDTLFSLILPALPTAFGTFLLRQYFMQIPKEYEESAMIDGANQWQIFFRIYFPLVTPGLAILSVLAFNAYWNEFFRPLIFMSTKAHFPIPLGLFDLQGYMGTGSISVVLAGIVLSMIPVLIVYIFGQRYLIEGLMAGGLKG